MLFTGLPADVPAGVPDDGFAPMTRPRNNQHYKGFKVQYSWLIALSS
jgi:hypothetical protein